MVGSWDVKLDRADARPEEPKAVCRGQCKILGIVKRFARVDIGDAVDIMGATKRNELHAFASVDGQVVRRESRIARMDSVVAMASF